MVSSDGYLGGDLDLKDLNYKNKWFATMRAYGDSKLANILTAKAIAEKYKDTKVRAFALHPGKWIRHCKIKNVCFVFYTLLFKLRELYLLESLKFKVKWSLSNNYNILFLMG